MQIFPCVRIQNNKSLPLRERSGILFVVLESLLLQSATALSSKTDSCWVASLRYLSCLMIDSLINNKIFIVNSVFLIQNWCKSTTLCSPFIWKRWSRSYKYYWIWLKCKSHNKYILWIIKFCTYWHILISSLPHLDSSIWRAMITCSYYY